MTVSLATRLAATRMGGTHVFSDLKPGDTFSFPGDLTVVYLKLAGGWFRFSGVTGRFRTGSGTAVVKRAE